MAKEKQKKQKVTKDSGGALGFEADLFRMADKLRGNMEPSDYKHVALGLIFLRYVSYTFETKYKELMETYLNEEQTQKEARKEIKAEHQGVKDDPGQFEALVQERAEYLASEYAEERDEYLSRNIFWVPEKARWSYLQDEARKPDIGVKIDKAMQLIEKENIALKGVLPKHYARPSLNQVMLGELIDLITNKIDLGRQSVNGEDVLGRVYEYFLGEFAGSEGKRGGEFYTPRPVVRLLVEMLEPYRGRIYDPCCGSGGMFVQSQEFVRQHREGDGDISVYGQESNDTTCRLAKMNLAVRGIDCGNIYWNSEGSFLHDALPDEKVEYILANPPFNTKDWGGERLQDDVRWEFGAPPPGNANYAWLQHIHYHLAPNGIAGVVLANGSMSTTSSGEGAIRRKMVEGDIVDCMVALPSQLFYSTQIPVCLWFLARKKNPGKGLRNRRGQVLFIDAREMGQMVTRNRKELQVGEIAEIARTYHAWRGEKKDGAYEDRPGFCKSATLDEIRKHDYVLTPGRYVGMPPQEEDSEPFEDKMGRLTAQLREQQAKARKLDTVIAKNLKALGFGPDK